MRVLAPGEYPLRLIHMKVAEGGRQAYLVYAIGDTGELLQVPVSGACVVVP